MRRKGSVRVALLRERDGVLNKDDDQALRDYLDKYQIGYPQDEDAFQYMKHRARANALGVYPKLKKESREWLARHRSGNYKESEDKDGIL